MTQSDPTIGRFFIALLPPAAIQAEVTQIKHYFKEHHNSQAALRSPPHITLQAPFLWPLAQIPKLHRQIQSFAQTRSPLPITLSGFAAFPPRVIYIDVERTEALVDLQQDLATHLQRELDIEDPKANTRAFRPHMTVAFRDLSVKQFKSAWPQFQQQAYDQSFTATELTLLSHDGRKWSVGTLYPLAAGGEISPAPKPYRVAGLDAPETH